MKTRIKNKEEGTKILHIEIPSHLVEKAAEEVYQEIKKIAKIPGFRVGSAPQDLLEKHYSKDAKSEILKKLIPQGYKRAIENHKVIPIGFPSIFNISFEKGKPLTFEAQVDIRPNIKLRNYKGIKVKKKRISLSQQELDDAFSHLRNVYAKYNDVARPVRKGDYAVCDVEAFMEGKSITKKNSNMWILADKEASLLGMGEELVGLTEGQAKEIETRLPENYPDKKYAGKLAKFNVLVNKVKEKELPVLDDAFAKNLKADSLEALKKEIESGIFKRKENALKINMKNQILDKLLKDNKFAVPANIVQRQKEVLAKRLETELLRKGLHKDEVARELGQKMQKLKEDARDRVRVYFILDDIALKEKIEINDTDIDERLESLALSTGQSKEEVKKYYEKENLLGGLAEEIKEDKVLEFLLKEAEKIEEK